MNTNTSGEATKLNVFSLGDTIQRMKAIENRIGNMPVKAYATNAYIKGLEMAVEDLSYEDATTMPPDGAYATLLGMPIHLSTILPKGVLCMFIDKNNQPLGMIVDETYERKAESK